MNLVTRTVLFDLVNLENNVLWEINHHYCPPRYSVQWMTCRTKKKKKASDDERLRNKTLNKCLTQIVFTLLASSFSVRATIVRWLRRKKSHRIVKFFQLKLLKINLIKKTFRVRFVLFFIVNICQLNRCSSPLNRFLI